jgi:hypothetical protein
VRTKPAYMNPPQRNSLTNDQSIVLFWDALSDDVTITGGSAIISYGLEWDDGTN